MPGEILRDDQVTGLHLRAFENRKSFYLYFRTKTDKERRPKLGDFGNITLNQARRIARDMLFKVSQGEDPVADRKEIKKAITVADTWPRYWSEHAKGKKTAKEDQRIFTSTSRIGLKTLRSKKSLTPKYSACTKACTIYPTRQTAPSPLSPNFSDYANNGAFAP